MIPPDRAAPTLLELVRGVVKHLLAAADDSPPSRVTGLAAQRVEELTHYLGQFIGEMGVRALFARSVADARSIYPWLAPAAPADAPWVWFRGSMAQQDPRTIRDVFVVLMSTFIDLLARLIGDGLMRRLLHDAWSDVFPQVGKETT